MSRLLNRKPPKPGHGKPTSPPPFDSTPASITVQTTAAVFAGSTVNVAAIAKNAALEVIPGPFAYIWASDATGVATVATPSDTPGIVTGVSAGTANITASLASPALTSNNCVVTVQAVVPPPPAVHHYLITPSNLTPQEFTTITVTAQEKDSNNANVAEAGRVVTWSKTGAGGSFGAATSVTDASGIATVQFTVGAGGVTHTVTGTDADGKTGTSNPISVQTVTQPPPVVDHYVVTPSTLSPFNNTTITVTAQAKDSGNFNVPEIGRIVTWSKTGSGGSFSAATSVTNGSGIATIQFTVGATVGTVYVITATDTAGKTGTTSSITVTAPSVGHPNEPAGMTVLHTHNGSSIFPTGWFSDTPGQTSLVADGAFPVTDVDSVGGRALELAMRPTTTPGSSTARIDTGAPEMAQFGATKVYCSFYEKISPNFVGNNGSGSLKNVLLHTHATYGGLPNEGCHIPGFLNNQADTASRIRPVASMVNLTKHDGITMSSPNDVQYYIPDVGEPGDPGDLFPRGQVRFVEILYETNARGVANGTVKVWINGVSVTPGGYSELFVSGLIGTGIQAEYDGTLRFTGVEITNVWGGGGTAVSCDNYYRFGSFYCSGGFARPGERPNSWVVTSLDGTTVSGGTDVRLVAQLTDENGNSVDIFNPNPSVVSAKRNGVEIVPTAWELRGGTPPNYVEGEHGRQLYTLHTTAGAGTYVFTVTDFAMSNNFQTQGAARTGSITITVT